LVVGKEKISTATKTTEEKENHSAVSLIVRKTRIE
jgi:hypothetical protein